MADPLVEQLRARYPRVALTHEWLAVPGGSEKVIEAILRLVPHAEIFCSVYDPAPFGEDDNPRDDVVMERWLGQGVLAWW